jgi:hypothetical protein
MSPRFPLERAITIYILDTSKAENQKKLEASPKGMLGTLRTKNKILN